MKRIMACVLIAGTVFCCGCGKESASSEPERPSYSIPDSPLVQGITSVTIGSHKLSRTELNYFYIDSVNEYCNQYDQYLSFLLDTSKPLDEQFYDQESGTTWADAFLDMAIDNAKQTYAMYDLAVAAGHKLSADEQAALDATYNSMDSIAKQKGFTNVNSYLKAYYGDGACEASYKEYYHAKVFASTYHMRYLEDLKASYDDAALRAYESGREFAYNAYNYVTLYLPVKDFDTADNAQAIAQTLAVSKNATKEKLDKAYRKLYPDAKYAAVENVQVAYSNVPAELQEWLGSEDRTSGDITYTKSSNNLGYYVAIYQGVNDNTYYLPNVRHILIAFEGGTTDAFGTTTYSDAEKMAAWNRAQAVLKLWKDGEKTEASFAALAQEHSADPGSSKNGGLYEEILPGQMVTSFNDWCFDPQRKPIDTGIVNTEFGCHIMFFSGVSDLTYRDYLITADKLQEDLFDWETNLNETTKVEIHDTSEVKADLIIDLLIK